MTGQGEQAGWRRILFYWGPVAGYAGLIFYLSAQSHPDDDLPSLFGAVNDKVLHALEYAGLGGLCYRAFRWGATGSVAARALFFSILTASLYGVTDEVHQLFVPFRESSSAERIFHCIKFYHARGRRHMIGTDCLDIFPDQILNAIF